MKKLIVLLCVFTISALTANAQQRPTTDNLAAISTQGSVNDYSKLLKEQKAKQFNRLVSDAVQRLMQRVDENSSQLAAGKNKGFVLAETTDKDASPEEQYRVVLKVDFDTRPIGGILSIEAQVTPVFTGIGVSKRTIRRQVGAYALELVTSSTVSDFVGSVLGQLAQNEEVASMH